MKQSISLRTLAFSVCVFLAANGIGCQPRQSSKSGAGEKIYEYEGAPLGGTRAQGGIDSGGGAGVKGQLLENFSIKIQETSTYIQKIKPVIDRLQDSDPLFAADLLHIARNRVWYLIPTNLTKIPPSDMVVSVRGDNLEQHAVQTESEVWIDKRIFGAMSEEQRADLIMHEMVIGVRMMEFQEAHDHCRAYSIYLSLVESEKAARDQRKSCARSRVLDHENTFRVVRETVKLSERDYQKIRLITTRLLDPSADLTLEELKAHRAIDLRRPNPSGQ